MDRLIQGIEDKCIQCCLLSERSLDFKRALEISQAMETADSEVNRVKSTDKPPSTGGRSFKTACYCCNGKHLAKDCHFKDTMLVARKVI